MSDITIGFGWRGYPKDTAAVWGARLIVTQDGQVDFLWDRQDCAGEQADKDRLLDHLNSVLPQNELRAAVSERLLDRRIDTREGADVVLFEDDVVKVAGNSNGSAGYFYLAAWLK
jgi:hypothetical protein